MITTLQVTGTPGRRRSFSPKDAFTVPIGVALAPSVRDVTVKFGYNIVAHKFGYNIVAQNLGVRVYRGDE